MREFIHVPPHRELETPHRTSNSSRTFLSHDSHNRRHLRKVFIKYFCVVGCSVCEADWDKVVWGSAFFLHQPLSIVELCAVHVSFRVHVVDTRPDGCVGAFKRICTLLTLPNTGC